VVATATMKVQQWNQLKKNGLQIICSLGGEKVKVGRWARFTKHIPILPLPYYQLCHPNRDVLKLVATRSNQFLFGAMKGITEYKIIDYFYLVFFNF
jgi:hypothetical protein